MRLVGDGAPIDGQDPIAYFQLATAVSGTPFNYPTYFVRHGHTCISRFCIGLGGCGFGGFLVWFFFFFGFGLVFLKKIVYIRGNMVKGKRRKRVEKGKRRLRVN